MPCAALLLRVFNARLADVLRLPCSFTAMEFTIRPAKRDDCPAMLELIRELAAFERAPDEVTVSPAHFEESGFGDKPVWWAFVACAPAQKAEAAVETAESRETAGITGTSATVQDPLLASLLPDSPKIETAGEELEVQNLAEGLPAGAVAQLPGPVEPSIPEPVSSALPVMPDARPCEQVIGFALYYIRYSTWKGQRMYLEDILVTESWRCKGVGTALMDALIAAARAEGLHGISWQVLEWNADAIRFYERYGARFDKEWVNAAIDVRQTG